ncbi:MAG: phospho-sugar mutase [Clostridia bacterium]|nr:phospho-sugar mutase [Clostridia bacterium]
MVLYNTWKSQKLDDSDLTAELTAIEGNEKEIFDRFRCDLEFGTGGLRGLIGAGTNRMNIYTVGKATQGLANCLIKQNETGKELSVAIAYDSRNKGELFTRRSASILAANGIKVYVYSELAPTPALSFAVRYYGCDAGICVTASHNPAVYNGYKVYGSDGCQIGPAMADVILDEIGKTDIFNDVKLTDYDKAVADGKIVLIGDEVFDAFLKEVKKESLLSDDVRTGDKLKIVYTPLNGAGRRSVTTVLATESCYDVTVVKEQEMPDGNFPTCPYPNPENPEALNLALALCEKTDADIMIATDPDCDRCRVAAKAEVGYKALSGNETGILLLDYICKRKLELGTMPKSPVAVTTIVSTVMADGVANEYGIEMRRVLTGFKYIGEQIGLLEKDGETDRYLFGFEESCGYLSGPYVRDKDGVNASLLICEMALYYKRKGITLIEAFDALCKKHGYYKEALLNYSFEGAEGAVKMKSIIEGLRAQPPKSIAGSKVIDVKDYHKAGLREGEYNDETGLPDSNVLEFNTENGCKVIVRPSGTEPKMKAYLSAVGKSADEAESIIERIKKDEVLKF